MIHFFPRLDCRICSTKDPEDLRGILESVTDPNWGGLGSPSHIKFVGEVSSSDFKIRPNIRYHNSFLPVIKGSITMEGNISVIDIKMRLDFFVRIFMVVWSAGVGYSFLAGMIGIIASGTEGAELLIASIGFFAFMQLLARGGFYFSAKPAAQTLEELLE